ncbi:hypothetical protein SETIT_3G202200v2 [Setaria italica]|uniref:C2H2-type domain-containing protein n=1 Tax=Setaria italica TaxID=4555 RepID=A0A368QGZ6_SETIT|nr:uncharacterized protein LOC101766334 isoform X1 [Setaria italica]RCV17219.1 hypothetical protein SETIT_3G202200v2 [Setaria italica]
MAYRVRETVDLFGRRSQVVSRDNGGASSLTTIMNYFLLTDPCVTMAPTLSGNNIAIYMKQFITGQIISEMKSLPADRENLDLATDLFNIVKCAPEDIRLNPMLSSIAEFEKTTSYEIFSKLKIPLFHLWSFSKKDADRLAATGPWTCNGVKVGVKKYKQTKDKVPSNVELTRSHADSTKLSRRGDIEEAEQLKQALITSEQQMVSVQDHAESSTLMTETEWEYLSTILDRMGGLGRALSAHSLSSLRQSLEENTVATLYRNDEFFTICKHKGSIFMLVDDEDVLVTHPEAVWKILGIGDQKEVFVDGKFAPVNGDVVVHRCSSSNCTLEFHSEINYKRHHYIHLPASKVGQGSSLNQDDLQMIWDEILPEDALSVLHLGKSFVKELFGSSFEEIMGAFIVSPGYRLASPDVIKVIKNIKRIFRGIGKPSFEELLHILDIASESTFMCSDVLCHKELFEEVMPRSDCILRNALACFSLRIEQALAQRCLIQMAREVDKRADKLLEEEQSEEIIASNDDNRDKKDKNVIEDIEIRVESTIASDTSANSDELGLPVEVDARDLNIQIRDEDTVISTSANSHVDLPELDVCEKTEHKLFPSDILHWPQLQGEEYFPTFAARSPLVTTYTLLSSKNSVALTRIGRKAAKRLLRFILKVHKSGKCWNGEWTVGAIRVRAHECIIAKEAEVKASKQGIIADLQRFIEILAPYYSHEEVEGSPAFFHEFHVDAMAAPEPESENFALFQKYMRNHLALMGPLDRHDLYFGLFMVCDMLRDKDDRGYKPLYGKKDAPEWRSNAKKFHPYHSVYYHDVSEEDKNNPDYQPYWNNYWELLRFLRNYGRNAHNHTRIDGVQQVTEVAVFDLMLSEDFGMYITKLILFLMYECKMEGSFFSTWDSYVTSDGQTDDDDNE